MSGEMRGGVRSEQADPEHANSLDARERREDVPDHHCVERRIAPLGVCFVARSVELEYANANRYSWVVGEERDEAGPGPGLLRLALEGNGVEQVRTGECVPVSRD